jgi:aldehyde:ferredoxin oxidoreductase
LGLLWRDAAFSSCPTADKERLEIGDIGTYSCQLKEEIRGGVSDPEMDYYLKVKIHHTTDRPGVCLHTFSGLLSLLTALQEEGILTKRDTGYDFEGDGSSQIRLLEMIARKGGIGEILADGFPGVVREFGENIQREDVDQFLLDYYEERWWDAEGRPTLEKLLDLGLQEVAGGLYGRR